MFKFYIFDPFEGRPLGTNNAEVAKEYAICEDYFVVNAENSTWVMTDLSEEPIIDVCNPDDN